jgi:hypothetical protein
VRNVLSHFPGKWQEGAPTRKLVAYERPVNPKDHIKKEHIGRTEVDKPYGTKPVLPTGFRTAHDRRWIGNDKTGYSKHDQA